MILLRPHASSDLCELKILVVHDKYFDVVSGGKDSFEKEIPSLYFLLTLLPLPS